MRAFMKLDLISFLTASLACLAAISSLKLFPPGQISQYSYRSRAKTFHADVLYNRHFISHFYLDGTLYIRHENSDPRLEQAYYASFHISNTSISISNGLYNNYDMSHPPLTTSTQALEQPFLMIYDAKNQLQGMKFLNDDPEWSRNMKRSIALAFQLDHSIYQLNSSSFFTNEKTVYGDCLITSEVDRGSTGQYIVTKSFDLSECSEFKVDQLMYEDDSERCKQSPAVPINLSNTKDYTVEYQNNRSILIKLIDGLELIIFKYGEQSSRQLSTELIIRYMGEAQITLPDIDFKNIISDPSPSQKIPIDDTENFTSEITEDQVQIIKNQLDMAEKYLRRRNLEMIKPKFKRSKLINILLGSMRQATFSLLQKIFNDIDTEDEHGLKTRKLYIQLLPHVGTRVAFKLAINLVINKLIPDVDSLTLLAMLPLNVRQPISEDYAVEMAPLIYGEVKVSKDVYKSSIFCWSTLIYKIYKDKKFSEENPTFRNDLKHFYTSIIDEATTDEMKVVYLMALKNMQVGDIAQFLTGIIQGKVAASLKIRIMAIWSLERLPKTHDVCEALWSILGNQTEPLKLRIAAYDIIVRENPKKLTRLLQYMKKERNDHIYNYHYTTFKSLANSQDPCNDDFAEFARQNMPNARPLKSQHLSASYMFETFDKIYNHGDKFGISITQNELTKVPEIIHLQHISMGMSNQPIKNFEVYLMLSGLENLVSAFGNRINTNEPIPELNVYNFFAERKEEIPFLTKIQLEVVVLMRGRVIFTNVYSMKSISSCYQMMKRLLARYCDTLWFNSLIYYQNHYKRQIINDLGLPVIIKQMDPFVFFLNTHTTSDFTTRSLQFRMNSTIWGHSDHSIAIYNPFTDVWHSAQRSRSLKITFPVVFTISMDVFPSSLQLDFSTLSQNSMPGAMLYVSNQVSIINDKEERLLDVCSNCTDIVTVPKRGSSNYISTFDSKDFGRQFTAALFDCNGGLDPTKLAAEWYRVFVTEPKNADQSFGVHTALSVIQFVKNYWMSHFTSRCGSFFNIKPSTTFPKSRVTLTWEVLSYKYLKFAFLSYLDNGCKNQPNRRWGVELKTKYDETQNNSLLTVIGTRSTSGKNDFNLFIQTKTHYPPYSVIKKNDIAFKPVEYSEMKFTMVNLSSSHEIGSMNSTAIFYTNILSLEDDFCPLMNNYLDYLRS